jgi:xanthine phosphoribosyltransferase
MNFLEERIVKDGVVKPGNVLKVDSFLNHQMDIALMEEIGREFKRRFEGKPVNKVLTIEASGIAIAYAAARCFGVPMVFAKKHPSANVSGEQYSYPVYSFTHKTTYEIAVSKEYLTKDDCVLITDDFLACGNALKGLIEIVNQAGATVVGCCAEIEKGFQGGGDELRKRGYKVESLAIVENMDDGKITFRA